MLIFAPAYQKQCRACGVIGSRARLRIWCRETCRFESYHAHKFPYRNRQKPSKLSDFEGFSLLEETSSQKSCGILKFHIYFFPFIKHCLFTSIRHSNCKFPLIQHPFIAATACINSQCPLGIIPNHRNFSISTVFVIIVIAFIRVSGFSWLVSFLLSV